MQDWQQRVVDERQELVEKCVLLERFILDNPAFKRLDEMDRLLLKDQYSHMVRYASVLFRRIERFKEASDGG